MGASFSTAIQHSVTYTESVLPINCSYCHLVRALGDHAALLFLPHPAEENKPCLFSKSVLDYFCFKAIYYELWYYLWMLLWFLSYTSAKAYFYRGNKCALHVWRLCSSARLGLTSLMLQVRNLYFFFPSCLSLLFLCEGPCITQWCWEQPIWLLHEK